MNPALGWGLAVLAVAVGWASYGWRGVVLALTVVVFWLLLQFSRALRAMQRAGQRPLGEVDSAVMLNAKLSKGMTLLQVIQITRSLGRQVAEPPAETFEWADGSSVTIRVVFERGRCSGWTLVRPPSSEEPVLR